MRISLHPENPQPRLIQQIIKHLENDGVIIFPTDTGYFFGSSIKSKKAMLKIYQLKQIDTKEPLTFIVNNVQSFQEYTKTISNFLFKVIKKHTPAPYIFIIEASKLIPKILLSPRKTIRIKIPDCQIALKLTEELGLPILSSRIPTEEELYEVSIDEFADFYEKQGVLIVDGGDVQVKRSSIIDFTCSPPELIRKGDDEIQWLEV